MINYNKVILGTGSYDNVLSGNRVSISGDGGNLKGFVGPAYKKLAPRLFTYEAYKEGLTKELELKEDLTKVKEYLEYRKNLEWEYIKSYFDTKLKDLDVYELLRTLYDKFGDNIIALCYEDVDLFCHRRVLADYIYLITGIYIPELILSSEGIITEVHPIRYIEPLKVLMDSHNIKYKCK